jgi:hypothetical protein
MSQRIGVQAVTIWLAENVIIVGVCIPQEQCRLGLLSLCLSEEVNCLCHEIDGSSSRLGSGGILPDVSVDLFQTPGHTEGG